jgi:hypothetical protein
VIRAEGLRTGWKKIGLRNEWKSGEAGRREAGRERGEGLGYRLRGRREGQNFWQLV